MQFYLKPVGGPRCLFTILNANGHPEYEVVGKHTSLGCKFFLLDCNRSVVGRIFGGEYPVLFNIRQQPEGKD
ncbi:MAG: hypothetical protein ACFWTN_05955 [Clostridium sp.]